LPLVVKPMRLRSPSYSQTSRERTFTSYWQRERPTLRPSLVQEAEVEVEPHQQVIIDFISFTSIVLAFEGDVMLQFLQKYGSYDKRFLAATFTYEDAIFIGFVSNLS
jgi:hypothetical protein